MGKCDHNFKFCGFTTLTFEIPTFATKTVFLRKKYC